MRVPADRELSCRGMRCPLPVIYTRKALAAMDCGQVLRVVATDPGSMDDIVEFSRRSGAELISTHAAGGDCVVVLRKP
jgi:tRNA 2-thiouridine synthesizing protein A